MSMVVGTTVRIRANISADHVLVDPGSVGITIKPPSGANIEASMTPQSTGVYTHDMTPLLPGTYNIRVETTAPYPSAVEMSFQVDPSSVLP